MIRDGEPDFLDEKNWWSWSRWEWMQKHHFT
jgi:hypothetical protein